MNVNQSRVAAVISYFFWVGWIIALFIRDRGDRYVTQHLNQSLVLNVLTILAGILKIVPLLGGIAFSLVSLAILVLWCIGVYRAATGRMDPIPFVGDIHIID